MNRYFISKNIKHRRRFLSNKKKKIIARVKLAEYKKDTLKDISRKDMKRINKALEFYNYDKNFYIINANVRVDRIKLPNYPYISEDTINKTIKEFNKKGKSDKKVYVLSPIKGSFKRLIEGYRVVYTAKLLGIKEIPVCMVMANTKHDIKLLEMGYFDVLENAMGKREIIMKEKVNYEKAKFNVFNLLNKWDKYYECDEYVLSNYNEENETGSMIVDRENLNKILMEDIFFQVNEIDEYERISIKYPDKEVMLEMF